MKEKKLSPGAVRGFSRIKALISVYFIAAVDNCGYAIAFALFPPLLLDAKYGFLSGDASFTHKLMAIGALYAAFPIAQLIGAPILGEMADSYGRKRIFLLSIFGTMLGYFLTGATISMKSITLLCVSRLVTGLFSGNLGLCNAAIADLSPDEKTRAKNYGILTVIWGVSFPVALVLGGVLSDPSLSKMFSPSLSFYLTGAITGIGLIVVRFFYTETFKRSDQPLRIDVTRGARHILEALTMPNTRRFFLLMLLWTIGWGYSVVWFGAYAIQKFSVSQQLVTLGLAFQGVFWTLGGALVKPIFLRYMGLKGVGLVSFALAAVFLAVTGMMPTFYSFVWAYSFSAVMGAVALSSTFNFISLSASSSVQGKVMGLGQSMMSLGSFLVPLIGGVTGAISIHTFYPIAALFIFGGFLVVLLSPRVAPVR